MAYLRCHYPPVIDEHKQCRRHHYSVVSASPSASSASTTSSTAGSTSFCKDVKLIAEKILQEEKASFTGRSHPPMVISDTVFLAIPVAGPFLFAIKQLVSSTIGFFSLWRDTSY